MEKTYFVGKRKITYNPMGRNLVDEIETALGCGVFSWSEFMKHVLGDTEDENNYSDGSNPELERLSFGVSVVRRFCSTTRGIRQKRERIAQGLRKMLESEGDTKTQDFIYKLLGSVGRGSISVGRTDVMDPWAYDAAGNDDLIPWATERASSHQVKTKRTPDEHSAYETY